MREEVEETLLEYAYGMLPKNDMVSGNIARSKTLPIFLWESLRKKPNYNKHYTSIAVACSKWQPEFDVL